MINKVLACLALLLAASLALAGPAAAAELDEAVTAAHRGDYAAAIKRLAPLAEQGDARAQFDLGFMHAYGWGFARSPADAIGWYRKAAEQGLGVAQHFLGLAYANGDGVRPNGEEAARWLARSAAQGYVPSQYVLGLMMLNGHGVPKDLVQGFAYMVLAGQHGMLSASRLVPRLPLSEAQRAQAQDIVAHWRPKAESSLASIADPRAEELLGLDRHLGEVADPASWPFSAVGVVAAMGGSCTGTLLAPKLVLTAAHCLFRGTVPIGIGAVHFLAGMDKGVPAASSVAERLIVAKQFVPTAANQLSPITRSPDDWALIVLKDALPVQPIAVKAMSRKELLSATTAGAISGIGYGQERRYSPTMLRNCRADWSEDKRLMPVQCLANFGYSGSPILADVDGTPMVVGILSMMIEEAGLSYAASASQFEAAVRAEIAADAAPAH